MYNIMVINPGSTSTKIALYADQSLLWQENVDHPVEQISAFPTIFDQLDFRLEMILDMLKANGVGVEELSCVMSRGGLLPPLSSGAYEVNDQMLDVLQHRPMNHHASNLGAAIADRIAKAAGVKAYIYDPVTVDEMIDVVRITGVKKIRRHGQGHNLNMRAAALKYCADTDVKYTEKNLIVAHLGGGITLSLHSQGRIIDMISDDEGPFSPERAGLIPDYKLAKMIDEENLTYKQVMQKLQRKSGLMGLLGQTDSRKVEKMIAEGDEYAKLCYEAMALGVSGSIGRLATVVCGQVDQIILTGGIANSAMFTKMITDRVQFIAPVTVIPGENEMQALASGAYRILRGEEIAKQYVEPEGRPY